MSALKGLEKFAKRLAIRTIAGLMGESASGERPDWRERPYRVLFLRHDRIGDMILTTGILRAIADATPTIRLDVLASPINAPVLRGERFVHDVIVFDRRNPLSYARTLWRLRRARYDAVIDCMVTAPSLTTLLLMLASGARHRIGVGRGSDFAYTLSVPPREAAVHMVEKLGALVTPFGLEPSSVDLGPRIELTAAERERGERAWRGATDHTGGRRTRLLVNVSAGRTFRSWPDERFVRVVNLARERAPKLDVLFIGSPSERARVERLARLSEAGAAATPSIRDAFTIVAAADVVFTADTSIGHAATAFGKAAAVLFVRGMASLWGPYRTNGRAIESATDDLDPITADDAARPLVRLIEAAESSAALA